MTTDIDLDAIRAREQAARDGHDWDFARTPGLGWHVISTDDSVVAFDLTEAEAEFIALARTDIPALIAAVQRRDDALAAVLALHREDYELGPTGTCCECYGEDWPCPTVTAITAHLTDEEWYCTACGSSGSHTYLGCTAHLPATPTTEETR